MLSVRRISSLGATASMVASAASSPAALRSSLLSSSARQLSSAAMSHSATDGCGFTPSTVASHVSAHSSSLSAPFSSWPSASPSRQQCRVTATKQCCSLSQLQNRAISTMSGPRFLAAPSLSSQSPMDASDTPSSTSTSTSTSTSSPSLPQPPVALDNTVFSAYDSFTATSKKKRAQKPTVLKEKFIEQYKTKPPPFGLNGLGELVYRRTYARKKADGSNEQWYETVQRVVEGTFSMQYRWCEERRLPWKSQIAQKRAEEMYDRIFNMKFLPPGRGLWAMGSPLTEERGCYAALNNCAFVSTDCMHDPNMKKSKPFVFLMDLAMLGVGVGFDTKGAEPAPGTSQRKKNAGVLVKGPADKRPFSYRIPDSREGWVESVALLIDSYFDGTAPVHFEYDLIRPAGVPIAGFGGVSSGPEALRELHKCLREVLDKAAGTPVSVTAIVDMMNLIGRCVVSGNVRQTAEIAFGAHDSEEYLDLKNYKVNPHRAPYSWTSNNSIFAEFGMDYAPACQRILENGEPGFAWLENMRNFSRMSTKDKKDIRAAGGNPCLEQTLESFELCCLVETFPHNHTSLEDFLETLEYAYLYAKTVTLGETHWPESNRVLLRNRRIGCSMSGIAQLITSRGINTLHEWCNKGYERIQELDREFSEEFAIPRSIKTTSIKPSGTVSLLAGATPGMHYPISRFCIRRVRMSASSNLLEPLRAAGYHIEPDVKSPKTAVVSIPIDMGAGLRPLAEVSMWEQLSLAAFLQHHWADNQVSCTVTFDPEKEGSQLPYALDYFQYLLKGVSFLPRRDDAYEQLPIEAITEEQFHAMSASLKRPDFSAVDKVDVVPDKFCDNNSCTIDSAPVKEQVGSGDKSE